MAVRPELKLTVFTDYICPFCYVGHHRLMRLRDDYELLINWCFLEIHPENDARGEPVSGMNYSSDHWQQLMNNLRKVATEEAIPIKEINFTTNSRDALILAEAAKTLGRETFYKLHESLFHAYFVDEINIGDREHLLEIAKRSNIDREFSEKAWSDKTLQHRLVQNFNAARQHEIQSVPSFVFGDRVLTGVVSEEIMRDAARQLVDSINA